MPTGDRFVSLRVVIYCVVPEPLADELYPRLSAYYEDDPNVEVIVDRRKSERRDASAGGGQREVRDRRRPRSPATSRPLSRVVQLVVHVDGGSRGNPGPAAAAAVVAAR